MGAGLNRTTARISGTFTWHKINRSQNGDHYTSQVPAFAVNQLGHARA